MKPFLSAVCLFLMATAGSDPVSNSASQAARLIHQGNPRGAAVTVRQALGVEPGNPLLRQEAAALLLMTGDVDSASTIWKGLLEERPGDPLAIYGLGVVALHKGDRRRAVELIQAAGREGDRAACLIAERYLDTLNGATSAGLGMTLPDEYAGSARGLSGMAAARIGQGKRAVSEITEALAALPGDPYYETPGVVMSFDPAAPVRFGYKRLPTGNGLLVRKRGPEKQSLTGVVTLAPENVGSDAGFVVFKIDGVLAKMANTRPFELAWNTAQSPNGAHKLEIDVYDRQGNVVSRAVKVVHTFNAEAPASAPREDAQSLAARSLLWQALTLRPSRHMLAYTAAATAEKSGDQKGAVPFWKLAAAIDPDYRDTRGRLESILPLQATEAVWKGDASAPVVALTFDDGPKPGITEKLVDLLNRERVPSTFFVIGRHAVAYPELIRKIADGGHQIENHTYTHPNLTMLSPVSVEAELLKTIAVVHGITGKTMRYFRPPGGNTNNAVYRAAAKWGITACMWTVDADALENGSPDRLVDFVVKRATPGSIILLHNGRQTTLNALPRIIAGLKRRGFRFDTIDGLMNRRAFTGAKGAVPARSSG